MLQKKIEDCSYLLEKQKAKELVDDFKNQLLTVTPDINRPIHQAKQLALKTVDEMYFMLFNFLKSRNEIQNGYKEFASLEQIKLEIKRL